MTLRNVNTPDNTPGAGQAPMLSKASRTVEAEASLIQIIDRWSDVEDAVYFSSIGSVTLPVISATIGYRPVLCFRVPAGKIFIPDWCHWGSAGVAPNTIMRVSRRHHLWAFSGATIAAPATPGAPSAVANQSVGMPTGSVSYKLTAFNNVGETTPSAASPTVTTGAATSAIDFSFSAVTGARRLGIYRTLSGQGGTGPWFYLHDIDNQHPSPYRDTHPESELDQTRQPPGANGTAGNVQGDIAPQPCSEIVFVVQDVALAASPNRIIYKDPEGLQENVAVTVTLTANSQTKVPLKRADLGFTGVFDVDARSRATLRGGCFDEGLTEITGIGANPATGQYNIYGFNPVLMTEIDNGAAAVTGTHHRVAKFRNPMVFPAGAEVVSELAFALGTTAVALVHEVGLAGRMITV